MQGSLFSHFEFWLHRFGGGFELMHDGDKDGIYKTMVAGLQ